LYIEGAYNSLRPATKLQSVQAYERLIELYPDFTAARNNLAAGYSELGRYQEALSLLEGLASARDTFQGVYGNMANVHSALGDLDTARESLELAVSYFPETGAMYRNLGYLLVRTGDFEAAEQVMARATALFPGDPFTTGGIAEMLILRGEYSGAEDLAGELQALPIPAAQAWGVLLQGSAILHQGKLGTAVATFELLGEESASSIFRAMGRILAAELALAQGAPARALALAETAAQESEGFEPELSARRWVSLAQQRLGRSEEATATMAELVAQLADVPLHSARIEEHLYPGRCPERGRGTAPRPRRCVRPRPRRACTGLVRPRLGPAGVR
jgi:tetratricopeptide (TPR) repeat protein